MLKLREYEQKDIDEILSLFHESVHVICKNDYSSEQLEAWSPSSLDKNKWQETLSAHRSVVVESDGKIVGFGDFVPEQNYLDRLYVKPDFIRQGIANMICDYLESFSVSGEIDVDSSITALPFFQKRGFVIQRRQEVERRGVVLVNFRMKKGGL